MIKCFLFYIVLLILCMSNCDNKTSDEESYDVRQIVKDLAQAEVRSRSAEVVDRNAIRYDDSRRWQTVDPENGHVIVPYQIGKNFTEQEVDSIREAMQAISNNTCVEFTDLVNVIYRWTEGKLDYDRHYVAITNSEPGCHAHIGRLENEKKNIVNFETSKGYYCVTFKHIIHELLHVVGLKHEQNRPDSENYVIIHYDNIEEQYHRLFRPYPEYVTYGFPYDYTSIMHYAEWALAKNSSQVSIETKNPEYQKIIGVANQPSEIDYLKVCSIYKCTHCLGKEFVPPTYET